MVKGSGSGGGVQLEGVFFILSRASKFRLVIAIALPLCFTGVCFVSGFLSRLGEEGDGGGSFTWKAFA